MVVGLAYRIEPRDVAVLSISAPGLLLGDTASTRRRLIQVVKQRQMRAAGALVSQLNDQRLREFLLNVQTPLCNLKVLELSIESEKRQRARCSIGCGERIVERDRIIARSIEPL